MNNKNGILKVREAFGLCLILAIVGGNLQARIHDAAKEIKALIITGQNSHNWSESSQILKMVLEETGLFSVEIAVSPPSGQSLRTFAPNFSGYKAVILNYNGENWPRRIQRAFADFIRDGGGAVVYHNSGSAFSGWLEYGRIIGLAGGNRGPEDGPYVFWEGDGLAEDKTEGAAGYHTLRHEFAVDLRDTDHPITRGLPPRWMHAEDELCSLMRGHVSHLQVLATAFSDIDRKGSGRHEPVLFTTSYGQGRVFHTTLGHASGEGPFPALECAGFIVTFQRGAEWAATGRVTQAVPADFPGLNLENPSPAHVRRRPGYKAPSLDEILEKLAVYEYGDGEEVLSRLRECVYSHKDSPGARSLCEERLAAFLETDATMAGKAAVCRHLRLIGTQISVPVLEGMLSLEEANDMARYALEKIPGVEAENALVRGLSQESRELKLGIISSLGQRNSSSAVPELGRLLEDSESRIQIAAARALGHIADRGAARALSAALDKDRGELRSQLATALLRCAEEFKRAGDFEFASQIYARLSQPPFPVPVREAAVKERIIFDKSSGANTIIEILIGPDVEMHRAAISGIREVFDEGSIQRLCDVLPSLPAVSQAALLNILPGFPGDSVLPALIEASKSGNKIIQIVALESLQRIGDASVVPLLAGIAASSRGALRLRARECLWTLKGPGIDQAVLLQLARNPEPLVQRELIRCIGERRIEPGKHVLFELARTSESVLVRMEAARNLENVMVPSDLPLLLALLIESREEGEREALRRATVAVSARIPFKDGRAKPVLEKLAETRDGRGKAELLRVLGGIGDHSVLPLLRFVLNKKDSAVYAGAVRAFVAWPDTVVKDDLIWIVQTDANTVHRVLALRAFLEKIGKDQSLRPAAAVKLLQRGLELSERPEEKRTVLSLLPLFPCPEAMKLANSLLSEDSVRAEAQAAVQKILYLFLKNKYHMFW